jgi:hypothetical protein
LQTALAVAAGTDVAAAASGNRADEFFYTSSRTGDEVRCVVYAEFSSTQRTGGDWALRAIVRISDGPAECNDGLAHLEADDGSGTPPTFNGGGSYVEVSTTTATEVTSITYDVYFNGCACYTPEYSSPK